MGKSGWVLLTGATGLLGRYLLRELLRSGRRVAVLIRDSRTERAEDRARVLLDPWGDEVEGLPQPPVVLAGDLRAPALGLDEAGRDWIARHRPAVLHAAACVAFRESPDGEPWRTNVDGTGRLLTLCAGLGLSEFHHVSTAFVCGERPVPVAEDDPDRGQAFHNAYERSKCEAERLVRRAPGVRATVYRPSVLVGDSVTGHTTTYHGLYRFLGTADRLAGPRGPSGARHLSLRLPFGGDEPRDLVPVDWAARAVVNLVNRPDCHGRTYHLVAEGRTPVRLVKEVAEEVLGIGGVRLAGPGPLPDPSPLEELFLDQLREYWPYLGGDPEFDRSNTRAALPHLPPPPVDRAMLARLIWFAVADNWGRPARARPRVPAGVDCAAYVERFFPAAARRSTLSRVPLDTTVALEVCGTGGGRWLCRWDGPELAEVRPGDVGGAEVTYRMDVATFGAVVRGRLTPQAAFFEQRIEIAGDVEKALKLAVLFGHFVREFPYGSPGPEEVRHGTACRG